MSDQPTDTRATAYVFGELNDAEAAEFEAEMAQSSTLREEVDAIREAVTAVSAEFAAEQTSLAEANRKCVEQAIDDAGSVSVGTALGMASESLTSPTSNGRGVGSWRGLLAVAAGGLIVAALVYPSLRPDRARLALDGLDGNRGDGNGAVGDTSTSGEPVIAKGGMKAGASYDGNAKSAGQLPSGPVRMTQRESGPTRAGKAEGEGASSDAVAMQDAQAEWGAAASQAVASSQVAKQAANQATYQPENQASGVAGGQGMPANAPKSAGTEMSTARAPTQKFGYGSQPMQQFSTQIQDQGEAALVEAIRKNDAVEGPIELERSSEQRQLAEFGRASKGQSPARMVRGKGGDPGEVLPGYASAPGYAPVPGNAVPNLSITGPEVGQEASQGQVAGAAPQSGSVRMKSMPVAPSGEASGGYRMSADGINAPNPGAVPHHRLDRLHAPPATRAAVVAPSATTRSYRTPTPLAAGAVPAEPYQRSAGRRGGTALNDGAQAVSQGSQAYNNFYAADLSRRVRRRHVEFAESEPMADEMMMMGMETEMGMMGMGTGPGNGGDQFVPIDDNPFMEVGPEPLSTFSVDVDTASYAKVRLYLMQHNQLPRPDAVRIEEMVNYFRYDYQPPSGDHPFSAAMDIADCPWNPDHRLARIGIKGKVQEEQRPSSNLVFLLDVSGSMNRPNKLPLVIEGMTMLTNQLTENDSVAIVVYAGAAGVVLEPTSGDQKQTIVEALERLKAGGSTNGGQGIKLAYQIARDHFIVGGTNRVLLCTDGDFNVGVTGNDELVRLAEENAKGNIYLSMLGFGAGNHNDAMMEEVSNKGNGNYAFIDSKSEARKVLVEQLGGTLVTIAKDVKIQVEFNPNEIAAYRLIGYENRMLEAQDFNDDKKDAGEIGAGHTVTALYELVPADVEGTVDVPAVDELRYQKKSRLTKQASSGEALVLKLRYKSPDAEPGAKSTLIEFPVKDKGTTFSQADDDFQFAAGVAAFGMLLRKSPHKGDATFAAVEEIVSGIAEDDSAGYRAEFLEMVQRAKTLRGE